MACSSCQCQNRYFLRKRASQYRQCRLLPYWKTSVGLTLTSNTPVLLKSDFSSLLTSHPIIVQTKTQRLNGQLQKLLNSVSAKSRKRETFEKLNEHIRQLEQRRTTTSLKLSDEKQLLRQIEGYERLKGQEIEIGCIKNELNVARDVLRETSAAIAELESALARVNLAGRLGCSTADLLERILECPSDKLARVIGRSGTMITQIEKRTGVQIEVETNDAGKGNIKDNGIGKIRLVGSETSINAAIQEIENITLAVEDSFEISPALATFFLAKVSVYQSPAAFNMTSL